MKTESIVRRRLERLRSRYLRKHVLASRERRHLNCIHNVEHRPIGRLTVSDPVPTEYERAPRRQHTLIVIREDQPVRLCMYGSESPADWPGDVCDSDSISSRCPMFRPLRTEEEASSDFKELLLDDKFVQSNYRDLAALQWVLDVRGSVPRDGFFLRLWRRFFPKKPMPPLLPGSAEVLEVDKELENVWRD